MLWNLAGSVALFAADGDQKAPGDLSQLASPLVLFAAIGAVFYFLIMRPQRREQARRLEMLGGVKKNDRVVTIGGVYGVVTNVNREADEVTIRVDESTNTKLRVTLSSIGRILGDEPSDDSGKK
jgi:preprotein translocase subunit YajC